MPTAHQLRALLLLPDQGSSMRQLAEALSPAAGAPVRTRPPVWPASSGGRTIREEAR